ncbi:protein of unknown function [Taphrina deformans PYCC 5710]|uniref:Far11/STRP C-terminal domain-containing protein n=1 Tax=Taphrina deformans (strain PYCC 5710 / ATCC 11124 / CBS 356.35 / IMI 108563 / JCM 9778 / NBRC 8474) TaxID=1097556 RepID=R4XFF3_TAPDE|nr:protein of unknown function [Taphrina deformans PYCC 5710]|eukprot:CCG84606.1 protein of unknown function [Taphrina deformans PYCC 5710]
MMSLNPVVNIHVQHDDPRRAYFTVCNSLSEGQPLAFSDEDDEDGDDHGGDHSADENGGSNGFEQTKFGSDRPVTKKTYNWNVFYDLINLLAITQKLVKKKIHRNHQLVQAKTWLHLRRPLRIAHDLAQLYCLKLYKGQVPLCSRKWRMGNMKVITQIYMSCRPELREDWIAGTDQDTDLEEAKQQEAAIRALILFFNSRRYPEQMDDLGFRSEDDDDSDDDFFGAEVARLP